MLVIQLCMYLLTILNGDGTISLVSRSMYTIYMFYVHVNAYILNHVRLPPSYLPRYQMRAVYVLHQPAYLHPLP